MKHVVVIGAGIVGLCTADALLRRGLRVTVLERDAVPGEGCSYGNGGLIVPSHFEPLAAPGAIATGLKMLRSRESPFGFAGGGFAGWPGLEMAGWMVRFARAANRGHVARSAPVLRDMNLASRALFEERYADLQAGYARMGELMVCRTAAGFEAEARLAGEAGRLGLTTRVLDREELAAFERGIEIDAAGAVYFEDDAHLTPSLFMPALRARVRGAGAQLRDGVSVGGFRRTGAGRDGAIEAALLMDGEEIAGDAFVLAAGAWTGRLARRLGLEMPLLSGKGYGFTVPDPPATPQYPAILTEGRVAVTPMRGGVRFVGTMELGLPQDDPGEGAGESAKSGEARLRGMRRSIAEAYPAFRDLDLGIVPVWSGQRPCAPDGMPYLGRPPRLPNVVVAAGHGMMGMSLGPISGELAAQVVSDEDPILPLDALRPDRYASKRHA